MSLAGLSILLVEDHADTAKILVRLLRTDGSEVRWAGSVAAALELAAAEPFDVVVSDLGLPDGSGLDVMRPLRAKYAGRAIALTGFGMDSDIAASREAGFAERIAVMRRHLDLACEVHALTERERDVLRLLIEGHPNRDIADVLSISPRTCFAIATWRP